MEVAAGGSYFIRGYIAVPKGNQQKPNRKVTETPEAGVFSYGKEEMFTRVDGILSQKDLIPPKFVLEPALVEGVLTVVSAKASAGKSILYNAYLPAKLSVGINGFTGKRIASGPKTSLIYSLEDSASTTGRRVVAMGGKLYRVHIFDKSEKIKRTVENIKTILEDITKYKPELICIDSLSSFMGTTSSQAKIDENFTLLENAAKAAKCALVIIHHPTKNPTNVAECFSGTTRIINYIRNGVFIVKVRRISRFHYESLWMSAKWQDGIDPESFYFEVSSPAGETEKLKLEMMGAAAMTIDAYFEKQKDNVCRRCGAEMVCADNCSEIADEDE